MCEAVFTKSAPPPAGFYSQAVRAGDFLFIAGQLPLDAHGRVVDQDIAQQTRQALSNVQAILTAAGGRVDNLVQCTLYISRIEDWSEVNRVYAEMLSSVPVAPARAVVPVREMHYGALIEIQAVAYIQDFGSPRLSSEAASRFLQLVPEDGG